MMTRQWILTKNFQLIERWSIHAMFLEENKVYIVDNLKNTFLAGEYETNELAQDYVKEMHQMFNAKE